MKNTFIVMLVILPLLSACASSPQRLRTQERGFRAVPSELAGVNWLRTPVDVLNSPLKDESIIWVGIIKDVLIKNEDSIEIEWLCEHLSFADPGPDAIKRRPVTVHKGQGLFAVSLILPEMTMEDANRFKSEHTATPHYMLVGGRFLGFIQREGKQVPFLYVLRFGIGPRLAVFQE